MMSTALIIGDFILQVDEIFIGTFFDLVFQEYDSIDKHLLVSSV